jgi:hypoxanthine phosphoribosyltransferase
LGADVSGHRVLVVDDVTDTGDSFAAALKHIEQRGEPREVRTLVLHHKTVSPYVPDYFAQVVTRWRWIIYPWAVVEDLTALIARMEECPPDAAALTERLFLDHGIRVPAGTLEDVLALMKR